jgi:hypothetical protein
MSMYATHIFAGVRIRRSFPVMAGATRVRATPGCLGSTKQIFGTRIGGESCHGRESCRYSRLSEAAMWSNQYDQIRTFVAVATVTVSQCLRPPLFRRCSSRFSGPRSDFTVNADGSLIACLFSRKNRRSHVERRRVTSCCQVSRRNLWNLPERLWKRAAPSCGAAHPVQRQRRFALSRG